MLECQIVEVVLNKQMEKYPENVFLQFKTFNQLFTLRRWHNEPKVIYFTLLAQRASSYLHCVDGTTDLKLFTLCRWHNGPQVVYFFYCNIRLIQEIA